MLQISIDFLLFWNDLPVKFIGTINSIQSEFQHLLLMPCDYCFDLGCFPHLDAWSDALINSTTLPSSSQLFNIYLFDPHIWFP